MLDGLGVRLGLLVFGEGPVDAGDGRAPPLVLAGGGSKIIRRPIVILLGQRIVCESRAVDFGQSRRPPAKAVMASARAWGPVRKASWASPGISTRRESGRVWCR